MRHIGHPATSRSRAEQIPPGKFRSQAELELGLKLEVKER